MPSLFVCEDENALVVKTFGSESLIVVLGEVLVTFAGVGTSGSCPLCEGFWNQTHNIGQLAGPDIWTAIDNNLGDFCSVGSGFFGGASVIIDRSAETILVRMTTNSGFFPVIPAEFLLVDAADEIATFIAGGPVEIPISDDNGTGSFCALSGDETATIQLA